MGPPDGRYYFQQQKPPPAGSWNPDTLDPASKNNTANSDPSISVSARATAAEFFDDTYDFDPLPVPEITHGQTHTNNQQSSNCTTNSMMPPSSIAYVSSGASVASELTNNVSVLDTKKRSYPVSQDGSSSEQEQEQEQQEVKNRSVKHYETEDDLFHALLSSVHPLDDADACAPILQDITDGQPVQKVARYGDKASDDLIQSTDWILPVFDPATTEPQTAPHEVQRLMTLQKYFVLDAARDAAFDRITALATRIFDALIALISLIDLGRQWFLSNQGLPGATETPRKLAFCAHAILDKNNMLVIPDASKDFRFCDHPSVVGYPNVRFYAGAPLVSPEGYKLGTLCIVDSVPRSEGLTDEQRMTLKDLADMVIKVMVDRRYQLEKKQQREQEQAVMMRQQEKYQQPTAATPPQPAQTVADAAQEMMTPLSGLQLSLSLLKEDDQLRTNLNEQQLELLNTAVSCSELIMGLCEKNMASPPDRPAPSSSSHQM